MSLESSSEGVIFDDFNSLAAISTERVCLYTVFTIESNTERHGNQFLSGEADLKFFDKLFSKKACGFGQRPTRIFKKYYKKLITF